MLLAPITLVRLCCSHESDGKSTKIIQLNQDAAMTDVRLRDSTMTVLAAELRVCHAQQMIYFTLWFLIQQRSKRSSE